MCVGIYYLKALKSQKVKRNLKVIQGNPCLIRKQLYHSLDL